MQNLNLAFLKHRADVNAVSLLVLACLLVFTPIILTQVSYSGDYPYYVVSAAEWQKSGRVYDQTFAVRPLYWLSIVLLDVVTPLETANATILATLGYYTLGAGIVYVWLRAYLPDTAHARLWLIALALGLTLVAPLSPALFTSTREYILHTIQTSPHHNPTTMITRPFALLALIWGAVAFVRERARWRVWSLPLAMVASLLIKPNWAIAFLPAWGVWGAWRALRERQLPHIPLVLSTFAATLVVLVVQYVFTFGEGGIVLAPFEALLRGDPNGGGALVVGIALSIAFPLVMLAHPEARRDSAVQLAWLAFGVAMLQGILFNESGARRWHGNFLWGSMLAAWVLFVACARVLWARLAQARPSWQERVAWGVLLAHVVMGALWGVAHVLPRAVLLH
jgi:hypothetical protein